MSCKLYTCRGGSEPYSVLNCILVGVVLSRTPTTEAVVAVVAAAITRDGVKVDHFLCFIHWYMVCFINVTATAITCTGQNTDDILFSLAYITLWLPLPGICCQQTSACSG